MNVYDFDGTIYQGDSSIDFYIYCLLRFPRIILLFPYQIIMIAIYKIGLCSKEKEKSAFFSFLRWIPDYPGTVENFWKKKMVCIAPWYLKQQKEDDVVISASPLFLLQPICKKIGINYLIASIVNPRNGKFENKNCYGHEKVVCFTSLFSQVDIHEFYSDSKSDEPMAKIAHKAYLVKKGKYISEWI